MIKATELVYKVFRITTRSISKKLEERAKHIKSISKNKITILELDNSNKNKPKFVWIQWNTDLVKAHQKRRCKLRHR